MATTLQDLLPLVQRIAADPEGDHRLSALADAAGLSPAHLQRIFAQAIGESPKRIALRIALERAAAALVTSELSVLEIALDSGFDSHEGFSRAFRRHFDLSPSAYRARGLLGVDPRTSALAALHREHAESAAPCVGLYRVPLSPPEPPMAYDIYKKTLDPQPFVFMRKKTSMDGIGDALGAMLPAVFGYVMKAGIAMTGPPTARYVDWGPGGGTLEAGLPVVPGSQLGEDAVGIQLGSLQGGPAISTIHVGPYDTLHQAHAALEAHMDEAKLQRAGAPWEVYLTDPGEVPNPEEWKTQVVCPTSE